MNKIAYLLQGYLQELTEKVTWPTWPQLQQSTMIVLAAHWLLHLLYWVWTLWLVTD